MKVSIIMPTFNRAWVIKRALDSVFAQTFDDFELIVIDDGSTDGTAKILDDYKDIRLIRATSGHIGSAGARNVGLAIATGEVIAYLDSDNYWHPGFLEVMLAELKDNILAYSAQNLLLCEKHDNSDTVIARKTRTHDYNPIELMKGNYIDINAVVHSADVLQEVGNFDEALPKLVDWDLFVRIVIKHPLQIAYVDQVLSDYYYYTASSAETITNKHSESDMLKSFGLGPQEPAMQAVLQKIRTLLARHT